MGPIDLHIVEKNTMEVNGAHQMVTNILQNIFFCVQQNTVQATFLLAKYSFNCTNSDLAHKYSLVFPCKEKI